jgi:hypothetical protein
VIFQIAEQSSSVVEVLLHKSEMFTLLILMFEAHWIGNKGGI